MAPRHTSLSAQATHPGSVSLGEGPARDPDGLWAGHPTPAKWPVPGACNHPQNGQHRATGGHPQCPSEHGTPPTPWSLVYLNGGRCGWDSNVLCSPNFWQTLSFLCKYLQPGKMESTLRRQPLFLFQALFSQGLGDPGKLCKAGSEITHAGNSSSQLVGRQQGLTSGTRGSPQRHSESSAPSEHILPTAPAGWTAWTVPQGRLGARRPTPEFSGRITSVPRALL